MFSQLKKKIQRFLHGSDGVVAVVFAMSIPMIFGAAGVAVDLAQAYNVKNRLADALDKAALAAGSTDLEGEDLEAFVDRFFRANYTSDDLGDAYAIDVSADGSGSITVSARSRVDTTFMSVLGVNHMEVYSRTGVKRELAGVEAVLVLDVTGSMDEYMGSGGSSIKKINALKKAIGTGDGDVNDQNFLNIIFSRITDPDYIKIGIVPYSSTVNVGPYGLGKDHYNNDYGTAFVSKPATDSYTSPASNILYRSPTLGSTNHWWGCILERASPGDTNDSASPNWGMYRYPKICSQYNWNGTCKTYSNNNPNTGCTKSQVLPMTNSKATLQTAIYNLSTGGNTYGNVGMVWGYHLITPTAPFTEGVALDEDKWTKTVIMMTDGDNNVNNTYSAYGANPANPSTDAQLDSRFTTVCNNIKADGITIYTITLGNSSSVSEATKTLYRNCATDQSKYFHVSSSDTSGLSAAFVSIANQLSSLHITE